MVCIILADDNAAIRRAVHQTLQCKSDWNIRSDADNGFQAVAAAQEYAPDLALIDVGMAGLEGKATGKIIENCGSVLALAESQNECASVAPQLEALGVKGCVSKTDLLSDLIPAIEAVLQGGTWFRFKKAMRASA